MQSVTRLVVVPHLPDQAAGRGLDDAVTCTAKRGSIDRECNQSAISREGVDLPRRRLSANRSVARTRLPSAARPRTKPPVRVARSAFVGLSGGGIAWSLATLCRRRRRRLRHALDRRHHRLATRQRRLLDVDLQPLPKNLQLQVVDAGLQRDALVRLGVDHADHVAALLDNYLHVVAVAGDDQLAPLRLNPIDGGSQFRDAEQRSCRERRDQQSAGGNTRRGRLALRAGRAPLLRRTKLS